MLTGANVLVLCVLTVLSASAVYSLQLLSSDVQNQYTFESTIRLNEVNETNSATDLIFRTTGNVLLEPVWRNPLDQLDGALQFTLSSLKIILVDERKNSASKSSQPPTRSLDDVKNDPFLVHWNNFKIENIYINPEEDVSMKNIKKAVASLFQFKTKHIHVQEMDICGSCSTTYEVIDPTTILKTKKQCISHLPDNQHPEKLLGTTTKTTRQVLYHLNADSNDLKKASLYESIDLSVTVKQEIGVSATTTMDLTLTDTRAKSSKTLPVKSVEEAVADITKNSKYQLKAESLYIIEEPARPSDKSLTKVVKDNREYLKSGNLGNVRSAAAFLAVLRSIHTSTEAEITKILKNKKNDIILEQFMDVLGSAQTPNAHKAVMKTFDFIRPINIDPLERYLWSLSVARKPKMEFVKDLISIVKKKPKNEKLLDSLVLSLTAMARKISDEASSEVYTFILKQLTECSPADTNCKVTYIRSLKNLKNPDSKSILLEFALNGTRTISVNALKVLYALPNSVWNSEVLRAMEKIYYHKNKKYDSSARVIAVDILIESNPGEETLRHLVRSLQSKIPYEIRKYLLQRFNQKASEDEEFSKTFKRLMKEENLNHYGVLAQRGLSNALSRTFTEDPSVNATLFCINEVSKAVLKRGHVSVGLQRYNETLKVGALDIFTGGLSSFLWSDDPAIDDELDEPEDLTAGIEANVLGVQIRPFVFFNGHGELMGHIWSGTASEKTNALQGTALLHEADQMIALGTGNILKFELMGAGSYDLSGQIQFSLWNRNAHGVVEALAGGSVEGTLNISSAYIQNGVDFKVYSQQKGEMIGDLDFYDEVAFCLRISQTDSLVKFKGEKYQKFPGTGYSRKQSKHYKLTVPGRTFGLNQKNNEMCNEILRQKGS